MEDQNQKEKIIRSVLPDTGIWTIEDFAEYLDIEPSVLQQQLSEFGVKVMSITNRYKHKLINLEVIANKIKEGAGRHATEEKMRS